MLKAANGLLIPSTVPKILSGATLSGRHSFRYETRVTPWPQLYQPRRLAGVGGRHKGTVPGRVTSTAWCARFTFRKLASSAMPTSPTVAYYPGTRPRPALRALLIL